MALALHKTVEELEETMSHAEFVEWQVFASKHPFGEDRIDLHFAHLCSVVATVMGTKHIPTARFLLNDAPDEEQAGEGEAQDDEQQQVSAADLSKAFGGARVIHIKRKPPIEVDLAVPKSDEGATQ